VYRAAPAAPSVPSHPLGDVAPRPLAPATEGGWLGPQPDAIASPWPEPSVAPSLPRPVREHEVTAPSSGRRGGLVAVLVGALAIVAVTVALVVLRGHRPAVSADPSPSAGASTQIVPSLTVTPSLITAAADGAPTDVKISKDDGTSVTLTWTDPSGGSRTFVAVQLKNGADDAVTQPVLPGSSQKTATFGNLDPQKNYCFEVLTINTVQSVPGSPPVCTRR